MADKNPRRRTATLFAGVALAGIAAGAIAVYVMGSGDGTGNAAASVDCPADNPAAERAGSFAKGEVAAFRAASDPAYLGGLNFTERDGKPVTLADFAGKTTLVNLWATWCVPCRTEMPALDRLEGALGGEDFAVVAINIDLLTKPELINHDPYGDGWLVKISGTTAGEDLLDTDGYTAMIEEESA